MNIFRPLSDWNRQRLAKRRAAKKKTYQEWVRHYDDFDAKDIPSKELAFAKGDDAPRISLLLIVGDGDANHALASIASLKGQLYANWDVCIACAPSVEALIGPHLRDLAATDPRIRFVTAPNADQSLILHALPLCTGPYVGVMGDCGRLPAHALLFIA
jgi:hypothetical protein